MPFTPFTFEQHRKFLLDSLRGRLPSADVSAGSFWHIWAQAQARGLAGITSALTHGQRQILPDTATGLDLDHHAQVYDLPRLPAERAFGKVTGTAVEPVEEKAPDAFWLEDAAGRKYRFEPFEVQFAGTFEILVTAEEPGATGNQVTDATLTFAGLVPPGLDGEVRVLAPGISHGRDLETDVQLQARIVAALSAVPLRDGPEQYRSWALFEDRPGRQRLPAVFEVDGERYAVAEAFVYRDETVHDRVYLLPLTAPPDRIGPPGFLQAVFNAVDARLPVAADLIVPLIREEPIDIILRVEPGTEARWDWTGSRKVDGATVSDVEIQLVYDSDETDPSSALGGVGGLQSGMRVLINGEQRAIGHVDHERQVIILHEPLGAIPAADTVVYPGGPVVPLVQEAVGKLFETVGPLHKAFLAADVRLSVLASAITDAVMEIPEVRDVVVDEIEKLVATGDGSGLLGIPAYLEGTLAFLAVPGAITVAPLIRPS